MSLHLCSEKYRLELRWKSIEHQVDGSSILYGAFFSGPALKISYDIRSPDHIDLDFTKQHSRIVSDFHIARLSWFEARGREEKILLGNPVIASQHENEISSLKSNDYIIIDCKEHEEETHKYHLVYKSYIVKETGEDKYE